MFLSFVAAGQADLVSLSYVRTKKNCSIMFGEGQASYSADVKGRLFAG